MEFTIILQKEDEGGYSVSVPELPGCFSQGETKEDAMANIREAMDLYLEEIEPTKIKELQAKVLIVKAKI